MQMLLAGHLLRPRDGIAYGATWCRDIEAFATRNYVASEQRDRRYLQPLECSRMTALWEFLMTCMLKVDPVKRLSAEQCLEAGRSTVFRYFADPEPEVQQTPTRRQRTGSASDKGKAPMRVEKAKAPARIDKGIAPMRADKGKAPIRIDKGKASTRVARVSESAKGATKQDQSIRPLVTAKEVVDLEQYNSAASAVIYNPGVDEAEVLKDQGSQAAATVRPTVERANDELISDDDWPSMDQCQQMGPAKEGYSDAQQFVPAFNAPGPSVLPNARTAAANNAQNQAPSPALINQLRENYGGALMNWMKL